MVRPVLDALRSFLRHRGDLIGTLLENGLPAEWRDVERFVSCYRAYSAGETLRPPQRRSLNRILRKDDVCANLQNLARIEHLLTQYPGFGDFSLKKFSRTPPIVFQRRAIRGPLLAAVDVRPRIHFAADELRQRGFQVTESTTSVITKINSGPIYDVVLQAVVRPRSRKGSGHALEQFQLEVRQLKGSQRILLVRLLDDQLRVERRVSVAGEPNTFWGGGLFELDGRLREVVGELTKTSARSEVRLCTAMAMAAEGWTGSIRYPAGSKAGEYLLPLYLGKDVARNGLDVQATLDACVDLVGQGVLPLDERSPIKAA